MFFYFVFMRLQRDFCFSRLELFVLIVGERTDYSVLNVSINLSKDFMYILYIYIVDVLNFNQVLQWLNSVSPLEIII